MLFEDSPARRTRRQLALHNHSSDDLSNTSSSQMTNYSAQERRQLSTKLNQRLLQVRKEVTNKDSEALKTSSIPLLVSKTHISQSTTTKNTSENSFNPFSESNTSILSHKTGRSFSNGSQNQVGYGIPDSPAPNVNSSEKLTNSSHNLKSGRWNDQGIYSPAVALDNSRRISQFSTATNDLSMGMSSITTTTHRSALDFMSSGLDDYSTTSVAVAAEPDFGNSIVNRPPINPDLRLFTDRYSSSSRFSTNRESSTISQSMPVTEEINGIEKSDNDTNSLLESLPSLDQHFNQHSLISKNPLAKVSEYLNGVPKTTFNSLLAKIPIFNTTSDASVSNHNFKFNNPSSLISGSISSISSPINSFVKNKISAALKPITERSNWIGLRNWKQRNDDDYNIDINLETNQGIYNLRTTIANPVREYIGNSSVPQSERRRRSSALVSNKKGNSQGKQTKINEGRTPRGTKKSSNISRSSSRKRVLRNVSSNKNDGAESSDSDTGNNKRNNNRRYDGKNRKNKDNDDDYDESDTSYILNEYRSRDYITGWDADNIYSAQYVDETTFIHSCILILNWICGCIYHILSIIFENVNEKGNSLYRISYNYFIAPHYPENYDSETEIVDDDELENDSEERINMIVGLCMIFIVVLTGFVVYKTPLNEINNFDNQSKILKPIDIGNEFSSEKSYFEGNKFTYHSWKSTNVDSDTISKPIRSFTEKVTTKPIISESSDDSVQMITVGEDIIIPTMYVTLDPTTVYLTKTIYSAVAEDENIDSKQQMIFDESVIRHRTLLYDALGTDMALDKSGATVIPELTSESFSIPWKWKVFNPLYYMGSNRIVGKPAEEVLNRNIDAGNCWSFNGKSGNIGISLAQGILPNRVSLTHVSTSEVALKLLSSAPKEFEVWAVYDQENFAKDSVEMTEVVRKNAKTTPFNKPSAIHLLTGKFDPQQELEVFEVTDYAKEETSKIWQLYNESVRSVIFLFKDNWGNRDYTCVYKIGVFGETAM